MVGTDANRARRRDAHLRGIGSRLADARMAEELSQDTLAGELSVSRSTVSRWESGQAAPDAVHLVSLAGILGLSVGQLLGVEP